MIDWSLLLFPAALLLMIPIAMIVGFWRSTGSIVVSGALAAAAFAAFWLVLGGTSAAGFDGPSPVRLGVIYGGALLALTAWALAINAAAQARQWLWVALLIISGYLTLAGIYASFSLQICVSPDGAFTCPAPNPLKQALIFVGYLAGPVAALVYGIRPTWRRARAHPDGLVVSSLRAAPAAHVEGQHAEPAEEQA